MIHTRYYPVTAAALFNSLWVNMLWMFLLVLYSTVVLANTGSNSDKLNNDLRQYQRALYLQAKDAFNKRELTRYQRLKVQLKQYPLFPYLIYGELNDALTIYQQKNHRTKTNFFKSYRETKSAITSFLEDNKGSYLEKRLRTKWLHHLASKKNWQLYLQYYKPHINNTKLQCHYWKARYITKQHYEKDAIKDLWLIGKSQPKECDFIFKKWIREGHLTQDLLWERHKLAINKGSYGLASYLRKKMEKNNQYLAVLYEKVHKSPQKIREKKHFGSSYKNNDNTYYKRLVDIIYHGIYRYAYKEPLLSLNILSQLGKIYTLTDSQEEQLLKRISTRLIRYGKITDAISVLKQLSTEEKAEHIERLLRHYLASEDWHNVITWIDQLPSDLANSERWRYWKAQALRRSNKLGYQEIFQQVAKTRSYYGFLSADILQTDYVFEDRPAPIQLETIRNIKRLADIQRSYELYQLKKLHAARTEWDNAAKKFSTDESIAAGQLAHLWGWNRKAIESMAAAKYWDDLSIRFPVAHQQIIDKKANRYKVSNSLIFSIARQESAWEYDAQSRVGARGLMQIMPTTAKQTARQKGIRYNKQRLYEPEYNIALGSFYIKQLLDQHNNNRPLAVASYNAGPHRVKQWLRKSNAQLDIDTWIEVIPFKETRKYVQNILAYEVIYDYRQGHYSRLLTLAEADASF